MCSSLLRDQLRDMGNCLGKTVSLPSYGAIRQLMDFDRHMESISLTTLKMRCFLVRLRSILPSLEA